MSTPEEYEAAANAAVFRIQEFIIRRGNELSEEYIAAMQLNVQNAQIEKGASPSEAEAIGLQVANQYRDTKATYLRTKIEYADVRQFSEEFIGELRKSGIVPYEQDGLNLGTYFVSNLMQPEEMKIPLTSFSILTAELQNFEKYVAWEEIASIARSDKEDTILRWPTMFTKDKQMGEFGKQLQEANVITLADRKQGTDVMQNLDYYWDTIKAQLDEVSSENEKNFANVADKLVNAATDDESTPTKQIKKAQYGWLEDITNPNMRSPKNFKAAYEVRTSEDVGDLVEKPGDLLEKQIKELFPDDLLTPAQKTERGKLIAEGRLQLIKQQGTITAFDEPGRAGINQELINQIIIGGQDMSEQGDIIDRPSAQDRLDRAKAEEDRLAEEKETKETYAQFDALTTEQGKTAAKNWIEAEYGGGATVPDYAKDQMADDWLKAQQQGLLFGMGPAPNSAVFGGFKDDIEAPGGWFDETTTQEAVKDPDLMLSPDIQRSVASTGFGMTPEGEVAKFGTYKDRVTGNRIGGATYIDPNTGQVAVDATGNPIQLSGKALYDAAMDPNSGLDWLTRAATITAATQDPNYTQSIGKPGTPMPSPPASWFEDQGAKNFKQKVDMTEYYPYADERMIFEMGPPGTRMQRWEPPPPGAPTMLPAMGPQDIDESLLGR